MVAPALPETLLLCAPGGSKEDLGSSESRSMEDVQGLLLLKGTKS